MEELLYESDPVRRFVALRLSVPLPDESTILNSRHLLESHSLGQGLLEEINAHLESQGLRLREGTIVDATIIEAPFSTKNRAGERDPKMHQTMRGDECHFGLKAHIGVDLKTGIVHSRSTTAANAHDVTEAHNLLHGGEAVVWGDTRYQGVHKREENLGLEMEWWVAMRPGRRRELEPESEEALAERAKASVRARVEHPFLRLKRQFGYVKVRNRGLAKNAEPLALLFELGNLLTAEGGCRVDVGAVRPAATPDPPSGPGRYPNGPVGAKNNRLAARKQRLDCCSKLPTYSGKAEFRPQQPSSASLALILSLQG